MKTTAGICEGGGRGGGKCPLLRGVRYSEVSATQRCPLFRGVRYILVLSLKINVYIYKIYSR